MKRAYRHNMAAIYLTLQGAGALAWWVLLLARPDLRGYFLPTGSPDATLLAFAVGDGLLFVGLSFVCAFGMARRRAWTWPLLCVHAGAAIYAALYCVSLALLTRGQCWAGAALMLPVLAVPPYLAYMLRPGAAR